MRLAAAFSGAVLLAMAAPPPAGTQPAAATVQERLGHPATARLLVIHADDLGMAHSVNRATLEALRQGWVTSASILVPCPWFPEVARFARAYPEADLGIHLALNSEWTTLRWGPVSPVDQVKSLVDPDGYLPMLETTVAQRARPEEAERELRAQIERARAQPVPAGGTMPPEEILLDRVVAVDPGVDPNGWRAAYEKLLAPLPPGVYEMVVHLAYADEEMWGATADHPDWGAAWRRYDLDLVSSPEFREFLRAQGFVLVAWKDLARARR